jgi:hypothetical protein
MEIENENLLARLKASLTSHGPIVTITISNNGDLIVDGHPIHICRKDLTTVEAMHLSEFLQALLKPKTTAARIEGGRKGGTATNRTNRTSPVAPTLGETETPDMHHS